MTLIEKINHVLPRKLLTASITGALFAVLLGIVVPSPFGDDIHSIKDYFWSFTTSVPLYLIYSFPVIFIYGTLTSILSDFLAGQIAKNKRKRIEPYLSVLFHLLFGLVLQWVSLMAAMLFFLVGRMLLKRERFKWSHVLKGLAIPILIWVLFMGIIWITDFFREGADYIVY
ncbi:hypothetical protein [Bacillus sinesaloumensis]|uniref:hypothetical protein n=1 Tax=Litchfieldia sinesaloumensis TaxID=1926280 RepID=UPI0009887572|nr:hypothetical protein [Bacillus sinesaloumensis]